MLLMDAAELVDEVLDTLEAKIQGLVAEVAGLPFDVVYSPDNLDANSCLRRFQSVPGRDCRSSSEILHAHGKRFLTGTGGPVRRLLAPLAATGVDGIDGISGPPQSDATLARRGRSPARTFCFGAVSLRTRCCLPAARQFRGQCAPGCKRRSRRRRRPCGHRRVRVPIDANLERLRAIPEFLLSDR